MTLFVLGAALLVGLLVSFVVMGLRSRSTGSDVNRLAPYRQRLAELQRDRESGTLDTATFEQLHTELERRVLNETAGDLESNVTHGRSSLGFWVLGGFLLIVGLSTYVYLGGIADWRIQQLFERSMAVAESGTDNTELLVELNQALEQRMQQPGDHSRARYLLARVQMERGELAAAARTYAVLAEEWPGDAAVQAQAAQAAYLVGERRITPEIRARVNRALALEANQPTALGLAGIDAFEQGQYRQAVDIWQRLLAQLPADSTTARIIRQGVAQAQASLADSGQTASVSGPRLQVNIELAGGADASGTLFVFARQPGQRMPLAAVRLNNPDFPLRLTLDDNNAMNPAVPLSSAEQVEVVARLSRSGQVGAADGDLEAQSQVLNLADSPEPIHLRLVPRSP